MNMQTRLASLVAVLMVGAPVLSASEVEKLRALVAEQEMQIRQLEEKIARLTDTPPPSSRKDPVSPAPVQEAAPSNGVADYSVKPGDSIERIARKHHVSATALARMNGLKTDSIIHPGQKLKVPGHGGMEAPAPRMDSRTHVVASGDTFFRISKQYGVSVDDLIRANPGVNHRALKLGQKILIERPAPALAAKEKTPSLAPAAAEPILNQPAPMPKPPEKVRASERPVRIEKEITYGKFAADHGTTTRRLDELNGLELDPATVLAQGSELYIPAQP